MKIFFLFKYTLHDAPNARTYYVQLEHASFQGGYEL